jgi:hypothetical protein
MLFFTLIFFQLYVTVTIWYTFLDRSKSNIYPQVQKSKIEKYNGKKLTTIADFSEVIQVVLNELAGTDVEVSCVTWIVQNGTIYELNV